MAVPPNHEVIQNGLVRLHKLKIIIYTPKNIHEARIYVGYIVPPLSADDDGNPIRKVNTLPLPLLLLVVVG